MQALRPRPGGLIRLALRRLLSALSLAVGVSLLLFLVFDSGLLGDPALRAAGKHADAEAVARAAERLGRIRAYRPAAAVLRLEGEPAAFALTGEDGRFVLRDLDGTELGAVAAEGLDLAALAAALPLPAGSRLALAAPDPSLPAAGLLVALGRGRAVIDSRAPLPLGWAEDVPRGAHFLRQTGALLRLDFGRTRQGRPVAAELRERGARSLALALPAFLATTVLALAAALGAVTRRGWLDRGLGWLSVGLMSVSSLVWVLVLQRGLAGELGWFRVQGWEPPYLASLALPVIVWVVVGFGPELRLYRALALEEQRAAYWRTARAKGCSPGRAAWRHLLPNLLPPVLTQIVVALPFLLLGSLLLERFFGIPGLGDWTVAAVLDHDEQVLRATTFLFALLYLGAQWLTDLAHAWADPRRRRTA